VEGMDHLEPYAINPMPAVLGADSSSSEDAGDVGRGGALPTDDVEAGNESHRRPAETSVLDVSKDEAESQPPSMF
jgi:hypothetical protein